MAGRMKSIKSLNETEIKAREQRLRDELTKLKSIEKDRATRKKVLYGAAMIQEMDRLEKSGSLQNLRALQSIIERHITRPIDREFLGLRPLEPARDKPLPSPTPPAALSRAVQDPIKHPPAPQRDQLDSQGSGLGAGGSDRR